MNQTDLREQMWLEHSGLDVHDPDYRAKAKAYIAGKYQDTQSADPELAPALNRHQRRVRAKLSSPGGDE